MTVDVLVAMDGTPSHMKMPSASKLRPSPAIPGSMEAAIKMWLQVGNVQKLQQVIIIYKELILMWIKLWAITNLSNANQAYYIL